MASVVVLVLRLLPPFAKVFPFSIASLHASSRTHFFSTNSEVFNSFLMNLCSLSSLSQSSTLEVGVSVDAGC